MTRIPGLCVALIAVLSCGTVRGGEQPATPSSLISYDKDVVHRGSSDESFLLGINLKLSPSVTTEADSRHALTSLVDYASLFPTSLNPRQTQHKGIYLFHGFARLDDDGVTLGKLQAGYGRIFAGDSPFSERHNGTAFEEPGILYLKASFRF